MKILGIIAEYNPFHNGHMWQLQQARQLTGIPYIVVVMSGNFTQRGEPACFDKWQRAGIAASCGADLVLELPTAFAVRSAHYFATGAIKLLAALHVTHLAFGTEGASLTALSETAAALTAPNTAAALHSKLQEGQSYAHAMAAALELTSTGTSKLLTPNNILAMEYLQAIKALQENIEPIPIKRRLAAHDDECIKAPIASASAIRYALTTNRQLTQETRQALPANSATTIERLLQAGYGPLNWESFAPQLLAMLRTATSQELADLPDMNEGLHYRLHTAALQAACVQDILDLTKTRRYTITRLQRLLVHVLLRTNSRKLTELATAGPLYARVLAFNENGRHIMKYLRKTTSLPLINKTASCLNSNICYRGRMSPLQQMLSLDVLASDIYSTGMPAQPLRTACADFLTGPVFCRS